MFQSICRFRDLVGPFGLAVGLGLSACGEASSSTPDPAGGTSGGFSSNSGAGGATDTGGVTSGGHMAAGGATQEECTPVSSAYVYGLTSPVYHDKSRGEVPDPERFVFTNNGQPLVSQQNPQRQRLLSLCAGPAAIDVRHELSGELVGQAGWDVEPVILPDAGANKDVSLWQRVLFATGGPGDYRLETITPDWTAPDAGRWRFHIFNGLADESLSARLVPFDITEFQVIDAAEDAYEVSVIDGLGPRESAIVEVDHPVWHDVQDAQRFVALQYWRDSAPGEKLWLNLIVPSSLGQSKFANAPDGTILFWPIYPDGETSLLSVYFTCRDPLFADPSICP